MNSKEPMSGSYQAVFIFTIFTSIIVFVVALGNASSLLGSILWGYAAWLMYKRKNSQLVTLFQTLMWISAIASVAMIFLLISYGSDFGFLPLLILAVSCFIYYLLVKFFKNQSSSTVSTPLQQKKTAPIKSTPKTFDNEALWERAANEFNSNLRKEGLWAKCFADVNGDENKAKASYLKIRVNDYLMEGDSTASNLNDTAKTLVEKKYSLGNEIEKDATVNYSIYSVSELFQRGMFNVRSTLFGELIFLHNGYVCKEVGQYIKCFTSEGLCIEAIRNESINKNFTNGMVLMLDKETFEPY